MPQMDLSLGRSSWGGQPFVKGRGRKFLALSRKRKTPSSSKRWEVNRQGDVAPNSGKRDRSWFGLDGVSQPGSKVETGDFQETRRSQERGDKRETPTSTSQTVRYC